MTVRLTAHRGQPGDAVMTTRWPLIFLASLCGMGTRRDVRRRPGCVGSLAPHP
jgi:hypothetical protein